MVKGKKGFDRLLYAFNQVLTEPVSWLFVDLQRGEKGVDMIFLLYGEFYCLTAMIGPIEELFPVTSELVPMKTTSDHTIFPFIESPDRLREQLYEEQLLEWIGLALIKSARIRTDDDVDPYLCRYQLPEAFDESEMEVENFTHFRWRGLVPARFVKEVLSLLEPLSDQGWFVIGSKGLEGRTCLALTKGRDVISWDIA
jgi:ribonuclease P/MRP protein subunit RPP40